MSHSHSHVFRRGLLFRGVIALSLALPWLAVTDLSTRQGVAQVLYGSLTGNVTDPSGGGVPNADVDAVNTDTGFTKHGTTDAQGVYLLSDLQPGPY
ncbi:MAG: carboxypeptidase regulatory-like domain-containing protein, partial [Acidobacteriaceae bacterium]|nr:carboxypeptidase regulatory-like domain-containing protein [Acidobacteriaceae bacterium]